MEPNDSVELIDLDRRIRLLVLELVDSAPPAPAVPQLEQDVAPAIRRDERNEFRPRVRTGRKVGIAVAAILVLVTVSLVAWPRGSSSQLSESGLGLKLMSYGGPGSAPVAAPLV